MLFSQGDRREERWRLLGCYRRLRESFPQGNREAGSEAACYDARRATFLREESWSRERNPFPIRHLGRTIVSGHSVLRLGKRVLSLCRMTFSGQRMLWVPRERPFQRANSPRYRPKSVWLMSLHEIGTRGLRRSRRVLRVRFAPTLQCWAPASLMIRDG